MQTISLKIVAASTLALVAFAGNSVLCRLALGEGQIDAASFTVIRLLSGALVLALILIASGKGRTTTSKGSWLSALMLFLYAVTFSYAYISLDTGTGALILFGVVQITMILVSIVSGNRLHLSEWVGVTIAFVGFLYLVLPSLTTPSLNGFILMSLSGVAWAFYTLRGRQSKSPTADTAYNFIRTTPLFLVLAIVGFQDANLSREGIILATISGAIASGVGYIIWYIALGGLTATQAAVMQLLVPVIAAAGGVVFANEIVSARLVWSSIMVLGGILTVVLGRYYFVQLAELRK